MRFKNTTVKFHMQDIYFKVIIYLSARDARDVRELKESFTILYFIFVSNVVALVSQKDQSICTLKLFFLL